MVGAVPSAALENYCRSGIYPRDLLVPVRAGDFITVLTERNPFLEMSAACGAYKFIYWHNTFLL
jgi:hypothetical protein